MDETLGALAEPLACAFRALHLAGVTLGSKVIVFGAGPIGLFGAILALKSGASWVAISDVNSARLTVANSWGVHRTINAQVESPSRVVREEVSELGADVAIDAVGLAATRREAVESTRAGGTVVFVGLHEPTASFDGNTVVRNETRITGCFAYTPNDFSTACGLLTTTFLPKQDGWLETRPLAAGPETFHELVHSQSATVKFLLTP
jgi:threonine dehydrogenase-like Zn-dependent dehydrogenase